LDIGWGKENDDDPHYAPLPDGDAGIQEGAIDEKYITTTS